ncbi:MAG: antitoxin component YwqK of YwqJK toxin-antitoxin module [Chitinophagales bacterium]|jgi:antitoxin component YwqK of YwqJK toxin-antitoxin module
MFHTDIKHIVAFFLIIGGSLSLNGQSDYQKVLNCLQSDSIIFEKEINEVYKNGKLKKKGRYIRKPFRDCGLEYIDLYVGTHTSYARNGKLRDSTIYNGNGIAIEGYLFTSSDALCFLKIINTDPEALEFKIGPVFRAIPKSYEKFWLYPPNQITSSHTIYKKGKRHGIKRRYWQDGSIRMEQNFEYGKKLSSKWFKKTDESKLKIKEILKSWKQDRKS